METTDRHVMITFSDRTQAAEVEQNSFVMSNDSIIHDKSQIYKSSALCSIIMSINLCAQLLPNESTY